MPELTVLTYLMAAVRDRISNRNRTNDDGSLTTEQVIWIAVMAATAIAILAVIAAKITAKANSINLG